MKWIEYNQHDLELMDATGLPIRAKLYYFLEDDSKHELLDVIDFQFESWEFITKRNGDLKNVCIGLCEFAVVEPKTHEDIREAPGPNSK